MVGIAIFLRLLRETSLALGCDFRRKDNSRVFPPRCNAAPHPFQFLSLAYGSPDHSVLCVQ